MALSKRDEQIDSAATYFCSRWDSEEQAIERADSFRRSPSPGAEDKQRPWNFWSGDEDQAISPQPVLIDQRQANCDDECNILRSREHHSEAVTRLSPIRGDDEDTLCGDQQDAPQQSVASDTAEFGVLFEGGNDDLELGKGSASQGLNASRDLDEDSTGESRVDPDPFRYIQKSDFVNEERSALGNCIGWMDFTDRKQALLQLPIYTMVFAFYPVAVLDRFKSTNDGKDGLLTQAELASPALDMNTTGPLAKLVGFIITYITIAALAMTCFLVVPLKALGGRERPTRVPTVSRFCNMRVLERGKSMPSGDTAAATMLMAVYFYFFGNPWPVLIVVPLVSFGRVYVHCHWIGDTIVGACIGVACSHLFLSKGTFTPIALPLFRAFFPHQK